MPHSARWSNGKEVFELSFWGSLLNVLDTGMTTPTMYGWFHLLWFALSIAAGVLLCRWKPNPDERFMRKLLLIVSLVVIVLEVYKQINYTFTYDGQTITADYQWYAFPFQFCSTPMYIGLLAGLTRGKWHDALCTYLGTFSLFAGLCVMFYPATVFISTIGINIQTMICHGSMVTIGIYLLYTGYVKPAHKTILKAIPVFVALVLLAAVMNEIAHASGLLETEEFNMFFISPYCAPSLPVYSLVQAVVPFPWCLFIYVAAFSLASYLILLAAIGLRRLLKRSTRA